MRASAPHGHGPRIFRGRDTLSLTRLPHRRYARTVTKALASLVSLALVVALATAGGLACPCEAPAADAPSCHANAPGLRAAPMTCGCACVSEAPTQRVTPRTEPIAAALAPLSPVPVLAVAPATIATAEDVPTAAPSPPHRHRILRI